MTSLNKTTNQMTKPRFGNDFDLAWLVLWFMFFLLIGSIFAGLSYASVQNNRGNVARDNYYAQHCKVVSRTGNSDQSSITYQCQSN